MGAAIKAEIRKLLTIRSTYVILGICVIIELFFSFFINGIKLDVGSAARDSNLLAGQVQLTAGFTATLLALIGILLVSHEYRYNTILYTVTSARSRLNVFAAKIAVMTAFNVAATIVLGVLAMALAALGIAIAGHDLGAQIIPIAKTFGLPVLFIWGFTMLAMIATFIIRSQIGAIAFIFFFPGTIESLIGLLLKDNSIYLPFLALFGVLQAGDNLKKAVIVSLSYIVVGWVVSAWLFWRRDAN